IMGHFVPAIPFHLSELSNNGLHIDPKRLFKPFITEQVIHEIFGDNASKVLTSYVIPNDEGRLDLEFQFATQLQVSDYFSTLDDTEENKAIKQGLFDLISNVILLPDENSADGNYHFRFGM